MKHVKLDGLLSEKACNSLCSCEWQAIQLPHSDFLNPQNFRNISSPFNLELKIPGTFSIKNTGGRARHDFRYHS